jgi:hypothetical protein
MHVMQTTSRLYMTPPPNGPRSHHLQHERSTQQHYTGCPTTYQTRHFFNNSKTNEYIVTRFEQDYVRCVRNEDECVCSAPGCCGTEQRSARQPACFLPDAPLCLSLCHLAEGSYTIRLLFVSVVYSVSSHSWKIYRYTLEE